MLFYDRVSATVPEGIEHKTAHIIGGGIGGLASAAFLASDAHMPAGNITVYEDLSVPGGSMDGAGDPSTATSAADEGVELVVLDGTLLYRYHRHSV